MKRGNRDYRLIKDLFKDKLKRKNVVTLSEINIVNRRMKEQWMEKTERIDPEIGEQIWARILKKYKMSARRRYLFQIRQPLIAACITVALIISGYFLYIIGTEKREFVEIIAESDMMYILPDSSKVWMHPESSIRFAKDFIKDRTVWLRGSSLFNVHTQSESAFRVHIEKAFIEVKGTQFLVEKMKDGKDEITLFHGCISFNVEATKEQIIMQPLQQIVYDSSDSKIQTRKIENIEWQNGKFTFNAIPLNQLLYILNKMYHADIVFKGEGAESLFSGTIRQDESLEDILDKICFIMSLNKEKENGKIIISH